MKPKGIFLSWIVVESTEKAVEFYTKILGFTLMEYHKEFGWAELSGPEGCRLGIAQYCPKSEVKAGSNAVMTVTVDDIITARDELKSKHVQMVGDIIEVGGHVKMQSFLDNDGNMLQLVQMIH